MLPDRPEEADAWLAAVGLGDQREVFPQRLSLGMARRVALARALAVRPKLLLLDEPLSSLDEATGADMQGLILDHIARLRPTTLIVTHELSEAQAFGQRIIVLRGSPARIVEDSRIVRTAWAAE